MNVRRASLADRDAVVRALARAFDEDPVANILLRQDDGRARAFETAFDVTFRRLIVPTDEAWMSDGGEGAALWTPPDGWKTMRAWPSLFALARAVGLSRVPKVLAAVGRVQKKHPKNPHWYLF